MSPRTRVRARAPRRVNEPAQRRDPDAIDGPTSCRRCPARRARRARPDDEPTQVERMRASARDEPGPSTGARSSRPVPTTRRRAREPPAFRWASRRERATPMPDSGRDHPDGTRSDPSVVAANNRPVLTSCRAPLFESAPFPRTGHRRDANNPDARSSPVLLLFASQIRRSSFARPSNDSHSAANGALGCSSVRAASIAPPLGWCKARFERA